MAGTAPARPSFDSARTVSTECPRCLAASLPQAKCGLRFAEVLGVCDTYFRDTFAGHPKYLPERVSSLVSSRMTYLKPGAAIDWRDLICEIFDSAKFMKGLQLAVDSNREVMKQKRKAQDWYSNQISHCDRARDVAAVGSMAATLLMPDSVAAELMAPLASVLGPAGALISSGVAYGLTRAVSGPAAYAKTVYTNRVTDLEQDIARLDADIAKQEADLKRFEGETPEELKAYALRVEKMVLGTEA